LDSLADVVSFGVAPGLILYQLLRISYAQDENGLDTSMIYLLPAFLIPAAGAWRLAKFNLDDKQQVSFKGVPVPAVGLVIASFPLIIHFQTLNLQLAFINRWLLYAIIFLLSFLMISNLPLMSMKIKDLSIKNNILYLAYDILFAKILLSSDRTPNLVNQNAAERFTKSLSIPIGFLLFTFNYHSKKRKLFAIGIILIDLLLTIYRARRGLVFICSITIVFSFLLYLVLSRTKLLIVVFSILLAFFALNFISAYTHNKNNIFTFLVERSEEDTRTPVEECLFADMGTQDWVIGKGLKGDYYCPYVDEDDITGYRDSIETDYLNIILKGGVINLGLLLLILVPAIFKGLFYSRNTLSKAAALWILLWMICLYPANVATFTLNYILVWISVGICYSRDIRNMPDEVLKEYFKVKTR
jgi:phosphatidylserine synthase